MKLKPSDGWYLSLAEISSHCTTARAPQKQESSGRIRKKTDISRSRMFRVGNQGKATPTPRPFVRLALASPPPKKHLYCRGECINWCFPLLQFSLRECAILPRTLVCALPIRASILPIRRPGAGAGNISRFDDDLGNWNLIC